MWISLLIMFITICNMPDKAPLLGLLQLFSTVNNTKKVFTTNFFPILLLTNIYLIFFVFESIIKVTVKMFL